ncbi:MAG: hybrid sensor histidine kinase/response regulator [Alphaproteobacteria bacterium PA2]|nr:MAG: hybrid sensor histidine kinase/response regulator [Alphaproteobacteria bacterium PA2]
MHQPPPDAMLREEQKATARTFALVAAIYYLLISAAHLAVLPPGKRLLMYCVAMTSAVIAIAARFHLRKGGPGATEAWMVAMVGLVTLNITLHGVYVGDREQIYYISTMLAAFPMLTPTGRAAGASIVTLVGGALILMANNVPPLSVSLAFLLSGPALGGWFAASRTRGQSEVLAAAQAQAQHLKNQAEQSEEMKTQFLANMSHEIRTPLNGVIGVSELLARTRLTGRQQGMVDLIRGSSETLERLLSDILDLSKIEAGKLHIEIEPFDLATEVHAAANLMATGARNKGLTFSVTVDDAARGAYLGDSIRLRQIVSNLVSNAVKFTETGGLEVRVTCGDFPDPPGLKILVKDTGPGFDAATQNRLFQRFEQADGSTTRLHGGSGLGLSIVKSLVELQGGTISIESAPGRGSQFEVRLPLARTLLDGNVRTTSETTSSIGAAAAPLNILLAEDNAGNRKIVSMILEPYGVNLTTAEDGRQAVAAFREQAFDLVLMDMQMPVMDGLAATRAIRELEQTEARSRTPIAMLSANALSTHRQDAEAAGCDAFVAKPIRPDDLLRSLEAILA